MSVFSIVELKQLKQSKQKVIKISVSNVPINPTIAITTPNKIHLYNQSGEKHQYELSRSITPTCIQWHPNAPILAIGWDNGRVTIWNQDTKAPKQQTKPHNDPIIMIKFNQTGTRMVTSDMMGMVAVWRGINLLSCYQKDGAISHCIFCDLKLQGTKTGNLFLFGGRAGVVCLADDINHCSDVCKVGGSIKALLFYQKESSVIIITSSLLLVQFKISTSQKSTPDRKVKLSIAGQPENLTSIWIGSCLLATSSNQNMIRFWQLQQDQYYSLTVFDAFEHQDGLTHTSDKINSLVYDKRGKSLVGGTKQGRLLFWKNIACGTQSPSEKIQWASQPFLHLGKAIQNLSVGRSNGVMVCKQSDGQVVIISQTRVSASVTNKFMVLILTGQTIQVIFYNQIQYFLNEGQLKKVQYTTQNRIKGLDAYQDNIVYWTNKKIITLKVSKKNNVVVQIDSQINYKAVNCSVINYDTLIVTQDHGFNVLSFDGANKQTFNFPESQGKVLGFNVSKQFVVLWSQNSYFRVYDLNSKDIKQIGLSRKFQDSKGQLGILKMCAINANGEMVGIVSDKVEGNNSFAHSIFHVYDILNDQYLSFNLNEGKVATSMFWDKQDPRFLSVQTESTKKMIAVQSKKKRQIDEEQTQTKPSSRDLFTYFVTSEYGIKQQDKYNLTTNIEKLFQIKIPFLYFIQRTKSEGKSKFCIKKVIMHDFVGLKYQDESMKTAILNFSFYLTCGNLDQAYKSVKSIQNPFIWQKMAQMCIKTKRLDVAQICIGNMRFARGARSIRQTKRQPQLESQLAMVAIQLDMIDQAKDLYESVKRYDLLNSIYQANGQCQQAIQIAQNYDRINLRHTHFKAAKYYQASPSEQNIQKAIKHYQLAGAEVRQITRMLVDNGKLDRLREYVDKKQNPQLSIWWGQFLQSQNKIEQAIHYYKKACSTSNIVRVYLSINDQNSARSEIGSKSQPKAAYLLAKHYQHNNNINQAINYYTRAQFYSQAINLAMSKGIDSQVYSLSLMASKQVTIKSANYFLKKGMVQKTILLFMKGRAYKRALDLAIKKNLHDYVKKISRIIEQEQKEQLGEVQINDPQKMKQLIDSFIQNGKPDKAIPLLVASKQNRRALDLCLQYNIQISEQLVNNLQSEGSMNQQLTKEIAERCKKQGNFGLASKLFLNIGDKVKAMKCLLQKGQLDQIIKFTINARSAEIFILAGNYLQAADWHKNPQLMKHIIGFYTKAKAHDSLSTFFQACSSVQIDEYSNYQKGLSALKQALKHANNSNSGNKQNKIADIKQKISMIEQFISIKDMFGSDNNTMMMKCNQMLQYVKQFNKPDIERSVRSGDIYTLMIEYNFEMRNYEECMRLIKNMKHKGVQVKKFIDPQIVYGELGVSTKAPKQQVQQQIIQDINY